MAPHSSVLAGESQGQGSLVGFHLWGRTELDTTEVTQQYKQKRLKRGGKNAQKNCTRKDLNDLDNHEGVTTHLQPDILESEVQWALESVTMKVMEVTELQLSSFKF